MPAVSPRSQPPFSGAFPSFFIRSRSKVTNHTIDRPCPGSPHRLSSPGLPPPELLAAGDTHFVYADIITDRCIPAFTAKFPEAAHLADFTLVMWNVAVGRQRLRLSPFCPRIEPIAGCDEPAICPLLPGEPDFELDPCFLIYAEYRRKRGKWQYTDYSIDTGRDEKIAEVRDAFGFLDKQPKWYKYTDF